jgi:hypothetical protein
VILPPLSPAQLYTLLGWIGGAASTAGGALFASKIRVYHDNRKAHLQDLQEKVLGPIRDGLTNNFGAAVSQQAPLLSVNWAPVEFDERAKVTEDPTEHGEVLVAPFLTSKIFGPIHSALLEDAKKNHYVKLMRRIDGFLSRWGQHLSLWHVWASHVSREILKQAGLEAFPTKGPAVRSYVMHLRLAMFLYNRLAGFATPRLTIEEQGSACFLSGMNTNLAFGERQQIEGIVALLDKLLEMERPRTADLRSKAPAFQKEFEKICGELDYALASRKPRGRCDLVKFL